MQRITTLMLSTLILAGMCLHAKAQDGEIEVEVIELEPGIHLKKKTKKNHKDQILRLKKLTDGHQVIIHRKEGKNLHENTHQGHVFNLDNHGEASIHVETEHDGDDEVIFEIEAMPEGMAGILSQLTHENPKGLAPFMALLGDMEGGEWQALAGEAMKHLAKVQIKLDGQPLPLMNLMSPKGGINFPMLQGADDIHVQYGKHGMHFPMKACRNIFKMLSQHRGKKGGSCCNCNHGSKKSKKSHGSFSFAPHKNSKAHGFFNKKHGFPKNMAKGHCDQQSKHFKGKAHKKNHPFAWSKEAPKKHSFAWSRKGPHGKVGTWRSSGKKENCSNCPKKGKASNKADFYFKKAPKKHRSKHHGGGPFSSKMHKKHMPTIGNLFSSKGHGKHEKGHGGHMGKGHGGHKPSLKGFLRKHKDTQTHNNNHSRHTVEIIEEADEDHHHGQDDNDLEEEIENLERQVQKLRKELRRLKKRI